MSAVAEAVESVDWPLTVRLAAEVVARVEVPTTLRVPLVKRLPLASA